MWKYLFLWQLDQPASGDTGGLFFPKAVQHTFVGLYIQQICLAALFFLAGRGAYAEGALMIILIVITAFFHIILNNSYGPLIHPLPLTLADRSYGMPGANGMNDSDQDDEADDIESGERIKDDKSNAIRTSRDGIVEKPREVNASTGQGAGAPIPQSEAPQAYGASVAVEGKRNDGPTDFSHPAVVEPQRIIWLPRDSLGLSEIETQDNQAKGIEASTEGATMDEKGHTEVEGSPPGMDPTTLFG